MSAVWLELQVNHRELSIELSWSHGYLPKLPWSGGRARSGTLRWLASETLKPAKNIQTSETPQEFVKTSWRNPGEILVPSGGTLSKEAATFGSRQKTSSRRSLILPKLQAYWRLLPHGTWHSWILWQSAVLQCNLLCLELTRSNNDNWP